MVLAVYIALSAFPCALAASPVDPRPGLEALRSGRFPEAWSRFDRLARETPSAPEGPFFQAFHLWWQILDEPRGQEAIRARMEERLEEAVRLARLLEAGDSASEEERALVYAGVSQLLLAQSRASRGAHMSAASAARQGHKALRLALEQRPDCAEALFGMGAYDYYADNVPVLVKGLRLFLFIPGGNEQRGIARLEAAAGGSGLFATESLMLLAHIYSGGFEEDYRRAVTYMERVRQRHPASPLVSLAHADLLFDLGKLSESLRMARSALDIASGDPAYPEELVRLAAFRVAACTLKLHDPAGAIRRIESGLSLAPPRTPGDKRRWLGLLAAALRETGEPQRIEAWLAPLGLAESEARSVLEKARSFPPDPVASRRAAALSTLAAGGVEDARDGLERLLKANPDDPRLHYDLGRLLQQQGRLAEARPHLQAAAAAAPPDLAGWAMVRLGWDLERDGQRLQALPLYRRAAEMKQFTFQAAARDLLSHPADGQPEG